jgi:hypothetical protein
MSSSFKEQDLTHFTYTSKDDVTLFCLELRGLLDKYDAKLYSNGCELYFNNSGFIGNIEDNLETIDIIEGDKVIFTSKRI